MTAVLIVAILCGALLAAYIFGTWMRWIQRREDRRIELLEQLLPVDGNTPECVLTAITALANAGRGFVDRDRLHVAVLKARLDLIRIGFERLGIDEAVEQLQAIVAEPRKCRLP